jgi:hypothetical protein
MKNGKPIFLPIPPELEEALAKLPEPKGTIGQSVKILLLEWQRYNPRTGSKRHAHFRKGL